MSKPKQAKLASAAKAEIKNQLDTELKQAELVPLAILTARYYESLAAKDITQVRVEIARALKDEARLKELVTALDAANKQVEFYRLRIEENYPDQKAELPTKEMLATVKRNFWIQEYLTLLRLRSEAKLNYDSAVFTGNQQAKELAQADVTKMMKYLEYMRPQFNRYKGELEAD